MRTCRSLAVAAPLLLLAACGTAPKVDTAALDAARVSLAQIDLSKGELKGMTVRKAKGDAEAEKKDAELGKAFGEMVAACKGVLGGLEHRANKLSTWKIAIAATGALVGGVAVPALTTASATANAVWISALGGLSGVANAAQQVMTEEGFTSAAVLEVRQAILRDWKEATATYFNPDSGFEARRTSIHKGLTACTFYSITVPDDN
jgi:hypothetical protein